MLIWAESHVDSRVTFAKVPGECWSRVISCLRAEVQRARSPIVTIRFPSPVHTESQSPIHICRTQDSLSHLHDIYRWGCPSGVSKEMGDRSLFPFHPLPYSQGGTGLGLLPWPWHTGKTCPRSWSRISQVPAAKSH